MFWPSLLLLATTVFAGCRDISGDWRNSKGSTLKIDQIKHQIHGTFSSAVEITEGSSGTGPAHLRGWNHNHMVSFTVKYPESMVAFTGQCYEKDGVETIQTTWLLHSKQETCDDLWLATRYKKGTRPKF